MCVKGWCVGVEICRCEGMTLTLNPLYYPDTLVNPDTSIVSLSFTPPLLNCSFEVHSLVLEQPSSSTTAPRLASFFMRVARSENSAYAKLLRGALCHIQRFEIVVLLTSYI